MSGLVGRIGAPSENENLDITLETGGGRVGFTSFKFGVSEALLVQRTKNVIDVFSNLRKDIGINLRAYEESGAPASLAISLTEAQCHTHLVALAKQGMLVYREFFGDNANRILRTRSTKAEGRSKVLAPTFIAETQPFTWEILYEGESYEDGDPNQFWGIRHAPARILNNQDPSLLEDQDADARMLFCLHHKLRETHRNEWPAIEQLIKCTESSHLCLLGPNDDLTEVTNGKTLLQHLDRGVENMVHFACHAIQVGQDNDALLVSLIPAMDFLHLADPGYKAEVIELITEDFTLHKGRLGRQPLVFLNACQSGGGGDEIRASYNLPRLFAERGAGAVIATICPVPDIFAAEFARVFYGYFLHGRDVSDPNATATAPLPIGEALRLTRWHFIEKHNNPLGLAYALYTPHSYQVAH